MKEKDIQRQILDRYSNNPKLLIQRANSGVAYSPDGKRMMKMGVAGTSDLIACINGRFVGIEVKTKTGKLSESQIAWQHSLEAAGGLYIVARSVEAGVEIIEASIEQNEGLAS